MEKRTTTWEEVSKKLGTFISVENAPSRNGCGDAPNQFLLTFENGTVFQSYSTRIGAMIGGELYIDSRYHDYSNTTSGYVGRWCGYSCSQRRKLLASGEIIDIVK